MKKSLSILAVLCSVVLTQCGKSDDDPSPNNPDGEVEITSVSPDKIYADSEITITGKGFSTTKEDNEVELGIISQGKFQPLEHTFEGDASYEVLSATPTQLVVKAKHVDHLNFSFQTYYTYGIRVIVGENEAVGEFAGIKKAIFFNLSMSTWIEHVAGCFIYAQAGDSLYVSAGGLYGTCTLTIDNKPVQCEKSDEDRRLNFRIPRLHFGQLDDNCDEQEVPITLTNGDGKSLTKMYHIVKSPPMRVYEMAFDKASYSASGNANLTIKGYSIYSTAMVRLSSANGYDEEGNVGVQNYPDEAIVPFTLNGLQKGLYNVQIKERDSDEYGFAMASFEIK